MDLRAASDQRRPDPSHRANGSSSSRVSANGTDGGAETCADPRATGRGAQIIAALDTVLAGQEGKGSAVDNDVGQFQRQLRPSGGASTGARFGEAAMHRRARAGDDLVTDLEIRL